MLRGSVSVGHQLQEDALLVVAALVLVSVVLCLAKVQDDLAPGSGAVTDDVGVEQVGDHALDEILELNLLRFHKTLGAFH